MKIKSAPYLLGLVRIGIGWVFLWAFLDKTFGLSYATAPEQAWVEGASPTAGFLIYGTQGPFAEFFQSLVGYATIDWLFMVGLLGIGVALVLGIGVKVAAYSAIAMLLIMYLAAFPPEHNPVINDHIIYSLILLGLVATNSNQKLGFGNWWSQQKLVKSKRWLE